MNFSFDKLFSFFAKKKDNTPAQMKYLIVGLGNIGQEYANTRHNLGFQVLDYYAQEKDLIFEPRRYGDLTLRRLKGRQIFLLKPSTYMNLSGKAVRYWLDKEKIPIENLLVIVDDVNLPLGSIRIRPKGSDGGHNGLKNICEILGHCNYARLRFGIGNDYPQGKQVDYVLGQWTPQQWEIVKQKIPVAAEAIESFVLQGINRTMTKYNSK